MHNENNNDTYHLNMQECNVEKNSGWKIGKKYTKMKFEKNTQE